jgi:ADP-ribose pyrophosphatase YjhB (NUDIX family)
MSLYAYCPRCGAILSPVKSSYVCKQCDLSVYENPKAAVAIIFYDEFGKMVLGKRACMPEKGKYDCIGGFLDKSETFEEAALREIAEEAGLKRESYGELMYVGSVHNLYEWKGEQIPVASVYFVAKLVKGAKLNPADDVASVHAFEKDAIPNDLQCAWPGMHDMLKRSSLFI